MKQSAARFFTAFIFTVLFSACKKDKEPATAERLRGVWTMQSLRLNNHYSGQDHVLNTPGNTSDIYEFRADGKIYSEIAYNKDTATYSVVSNNSLVIDGDAYEIQALSEKSLKIYHKESYGADYDEITMSLVK